MSVADLFTKPVVWTLVSQDTGAEIEGQYPPQDVQQNVGGEWAQQGTIGLDQPILQFVGGELDVITFTAKVFAKHRGLLGTGIGADDIQETVDSLLELPRRDPDLGRPHVWLFALGTQLSQRVIVKSVGGVKYDRIRNDGTLRGVLFPITLWRYEPYSVSGLAEAESLVTPAREGETYEHVANRVHGDPLLGEALRRRNPDRRQLTPGDLVHVPSRAILRREVFPLAPQSLPLRAGAAQRQNIIDAFKARGGSVVSHVILDDWNG